MKFAAYIQLPKKINSSSFPAAPAAGQGFYSLSEISQHKLDKLYNYIYASQTMYSRDSDSDSTFVIRSEIS